MALKITGVGKKPGFAHDFADHLEAESVKAHTMVKPTKNLPESVKEESLSAPLSIPYTDLHHIEIGAGMTVNLGNYESGRVDVRIRIPCSKDDLASSYEWGTKWVSDRMEEEVKNMKAASHGN